MTSAYILQCLLWARGYLDWEPGHVHFRELSVTWNNEQQCVLMWPHAQAAERSVVYCSLGAGIISELFSRSLKWPERLGVLQTQKVLMAETWSFSGGCLIISAFLQLIQPNKTHATAANQIIRGLNLHNWSPALSSSVSASVSFCPSLPSSYSHFHLAFLICLSFYSPHFPLHSSFLSLSFILDFPPLFFSSSSLLYFLLVLIVSTSFPSCICSCLSFVFLFPTVQIVQNAQICNAEARYFTTAFLIKTHSKTRLSDLFLLQRYSHYV